MLTLMHERGLPQGSVLQQMAMKVHSKTDHVGLGVAKAQVVA